VEVIADGQHVLDRAAEAVELPDDERVAGAQVVERRESASSQLSDDQLAKMSGADISKAMSAGRVPGIGARRRPRHR
jgi:hypothetical protein